MHNCTHAGFKYCLVYLNALLRETAITFSSQSSVRREQRSLAPLSIFHPLSLLYQPPSFPLYLQPPSSAVILPFMTSPHFLSLCRNVLSLIYHVTLPCFSPSPVPHHPQLPSPLFLIISTLSLSASALLSLVRPRPTAYPSLLSSFITFSSQTGWDGHFTW